MRRGRGELAGAPRPGRSTTRNQRYLRGLRMPFTALTRCRGVATVLIRLTAARASAVLMPRVCGATGVIRMTTGAGSGM